MRLYENHTGITAEQALESIEAETCMKILQSIAALPEKVSQTDCVQGVNGLVADAAGLPRSE